MKVRIDQLLVMLGYFDSREKAKRALMAGEIFSGTQRIEKAGTMVKEDIELTVKSQKQKFVSRGGLKLEKAIKEFNISLDSKICMDIGASTGGFTDCMLQNKANKVYSIDVGYGQLDYSLRNNERVIVMERTNARYLNEIDIEDICDFASFDVSFISLKTVMPAVVTKLKQGAEIVCLVKPQFEAGREFVGKKGVVRDKNTHMNVLKDVVKSLVKEGLKLNNLSYSPITGPNGNIEFLAYLTVDSDVLIDEAFLIQLDDLVKKIVDVAHRNLFE